MCLKLPAQDGFNSKPEDTYIFFSILSYIKLPLGLWEIYTRITRLYKYGEYTALY